MRPKILVILGSTRQGRAGESVAALDHVYWEWNRKPIAFVSYGAAGGGYRATEQLRSVAVELQMVPIREQLAILFVLMAFDESGAIRQKGADKAVERMVDELMWWAGALKQARFGDLVAA